MCLDSQTRVSECCGFVCLRQLWLVVRKVRQQRHLSVAAEYWGGILLNAGICWLWDILRLLDEGLHSLLAICWSPHDFLSESTNDSTGAETETDAKF